MDSLGVEFVNSKLSILSIRPGQGAILLAFEIYSDDADV